MNVNLQKESLNSFKKILDETVCHEETNETIVSDSLPDIYDISCCYGTVLVRSKEATEGKATITGFVNTVVLYHPDNAGSERCITASVPFTVGFECENIKETTRLIASVSLAALDARILNPRKLLIKAEVLANISGYCPQTLELYSGMDDTTKGIEILKANETVSVVSDVREKSFVISDSYTLPPSNQPIGELLDTRTELSVDDIKCVGNKLIFKGTVKLRFIYKSEKDDKICVTETTSSFSQIMESESDETAKCKVTLFPTGLYFDVDSLDNESHTVTAEMHIVAQVEVMRSTGINYIADIYSTCNAIEYKTEASSIACTMEPVIISDILRETIRVGTEQVHVIDTSIYLGRVSCENKNDRTEIIVPVIARTFFEDGEGYLRSATGNFELCAQTELEEEYSYNINAMLSQDATVSESEDGIVLKIPVRLEITPAQIKTVSCVSEVSYNESEFIDISAMPSVVIRRLYNGETVWQLAKQYCSTVEMILKANDIESEENMDRSTALLIPKKRLK